MTQSHLFSLDSLSITFPVGRDPRSTLSGISIQIGEGECIALVGESGSGKTITCLAALGLLRGATISGRLFWRGEEYDLSVPSKLASLRGRHIAMLPQNFSGAFNPVRTLGAQMVDVIRFHHGGNKQVALEQAASLLAELGVSNPERRLREFPHQQSGGILQRTALAMALSCEPELLIADEPTSALDVTAQHLMLELLSRVAESRNLALLLISHNLAVVGRMANRICVMADGKIIEEGMTVDILTKPRTDAATKLLQAAKALALP